MSTKVKGETIKEGSIPLSALSNEVKDKIENAGGGADWKAQEGEPGYIENKPFITIKSNNNEIANINSYFILTENVFYPNNDLFIKYNNKIALLAKEKQEVYYGDGCFLELDGGYFNLVDYDESTIIVTSESEFELIIALNSEFIPNTVIKTTPQSLSDTDKNQALTNLGIDPVVWKYITDPRWIIPDNPIPEDLANIIYNNDDYMLNSIIKNVCVFHTTTEEGDCFEYIFSVNLTDDIVYTKDNTNTTSRYKYNRTSRTFTKY